MTSERNEEMVKSDIIQATADDGKVKILHDYILEECKRQNYTVYELEKLILAMTAVLETDKQELYNKTLLFRENTT